MSNPPRCDARRPGLLRQLHQDWWAHGRSASRPGFQAIAVQRLGARRLTLPPLLAALVTPVYRILHVFVRNVYGIEIHDTTKLGRDVRIGHQGGIVVHEFAELGDGCVIRQNVTIGAATEEGWRRQAPRLGENVSVGAGAVIMGDITVGDNASIGPNAVVITNVPPGARVFVDAPRMMAGPVPGASP